MRSFVTYVHAPLSLYDKVRLIVGIVPLDLRWVQANARAAMGDANIFDAASDLPTSPRALQSVINIPNSLLSLWPSLLIHTSHNAASIMCFVTVSQFTMSLTVGDVVATRHPFSSALVFFFSFFFVFLPPSHRTTFISNDHLSPVV
jgi:hypothetical protein